MTSKPAVVDCDVHPVPPGLQVLLPYLDDYWRNSVVERGIPSLETNSYPPRAPLSARPQARGEKGNPQATLAQLTEQVFGCWQADRAVCNCLYGVELLFSEDMAAAVARALNDWMVKEWLDRDPRLSASMVVPTQNIELAVDEIERCAKDRRFVQILLFAMQESPLGRRHWWPIYAAAARHDLPIGIHPGSTYRHSLTSLGWPRSRTCELMGKKRYWPIYQAAAEAGFPVGVHVFGTSGRPASNSGWPSFYIEDMTEHAACCQAQVTSLVMEGVFERYPGLKVVLIEAGFAWLPALGWRLDKLWKRLRDEVPHLKQLPSEYMREHIWVSTQPMEETEVAKHLMDVMNWIGWERFMFASDYPHWDFDDPLTALPPSLDETQREKIFSANARALYRLA